MTQRRDWFAPKRYGYGAGFPIAWQGWLVLSVYLAVTIGGAFYLAPRQPAALFVLVVIMSLALLQITKRTTRGGWQWRWGEKD